MTKVTFEQERPTDYLQRLAASNVAGHHKAEALRRLAVRAGQVVVDLGCGPGADLGRFADATGPGGAVVGVDSDPGAIRDVAAAFAARPWVTGMLGDVHAVDLPTASADRVHTDRVLQHVGDPGGVVAEARRLLGPDGRAVFAEPDWDTLLIDHPDLAVARAYRSFITDRVIRNPAVGRQLARLAQDAGFTVTDVHPVTRVLREAEEADHVFGFARVTARAERAGYLDSGQAAEWLDHLATRPFLASITMFVVTAEA